MHEDKVLDARDLFGNYRIVVAENSRKTERGHWLETFAKETGKPLKYVAFRLTGVPTGDLYAIDRMCRAYNGGYAKCFFGALKIRPPELFAGAGKK